MTIHYKKLLWFANLMLSNPYGLTKREIDKAWERSGFCNDNQVHDFNFDGEVESRISLPRSTMYRFIEAIEEMFNLQIVCQKSTNLWIIDQVNKATYGEVVCQLREVLAVLDAFNQDEAFSDNIADFETSYGIEDLNQVLEAIKTKSIINFIYKDNGHPFKFKPYGLKKFNREWYVVGEEVLPKGIISPIGAFPLEIMHVLEISDQKFEMPSDFNINDYYSDFVGPLVDNSIPKEHILVKFDKRVGRHIDAHTIHHSQNLLEVNDDAMTFEFDLRPTEDFYRELRKYGSQVEVLEPQNVKE